MNIIGPIAAAWLVAIAYGMAEGWRGPSGYAEVLGLALTGALAALLVRGIGDLVASRLADNGPSPALIRSLSLRNLLLACVTGWMVGAAAAYLAGPHDRPLGEPRWSAAQFAAVTLLAGLVAYGELVSRYKDAPGRLMSADPTVIYICVNVAAGTTALAIVKHFGILADSQHPMVYQTLLAGFGAIAFFRTSLFTIRVSGTDVGVGPSTLLKALLDSSDMMLNRWQALNRGARVKTIMAGVDFGKAKFALPSTCFTLMNEFPAAVQANVGEQVKKLEADAMADESKTIILGLYMIQQVGVEVLDRAVKTLGDNIK